MLLFISNSKTILVSLFKDLILLFQVIYAEPEVKGGWSRNSVIPEVAHDLAYWGQRSFRSREVSTTTSLPA